MSVKAPHQSKVTVDGVEYTLQHPGARWYIKLTDRSNGKNEVLADELLENVVVNPRVTIEDFDDNIEALEELLEKAHTFLKTKRRRESQAAS